MVFSFTLFTYNGQRLFRLNRKLYLTKNIGEHLNWVKTHRKALTYLSIIAGLTGLVCLYFMDIKSWLILIPTGIISFFYVVPIIPFYDKSPTLRDLPYLKIILIAIVWSLIIVWLPFVNINDTIGLSNQDFIIAIIQTALFVIAITIPFDIRDLEYDNSTNLKTFPQLFGIKGALLFSSLLLICSSYLITLLPLEKRHIYALIFGLCITLFLILLTKKSRKELFFAGLIEGTVLILYGCVLIADCLYSL